jgi:O-antigen/teichoic acid export membrane protein
LKRESPLNNTFALVLERLVSATASFLATFVVARYLLPEHFGQLSFLLALVSLLGPLMALGLNSLLTSELLKRPIDQQDIIGTAIFLRLSCGLVVAVVSTLAAYPLIENWHLFAMLVFSSIWGAFSVIDFWLQANLANQYAALLRVGSVLFVSVLRFCAVWMGAGLHVFVLFCCLDFCVVGFGYILLYKKFSNGGQNLRISRDEICKLLNDSKWLFFSGIAAMIYLKVDQVMLGVLLDNKAVGIYSGAVKLSEVWYFIPAALMTAYFPRLLQTRVSNRTEYLAEIQKLNDVLFIIAFIIAFTVTCSADWLVNLVFGTAFSESASILVIHVWAAIFVFMRALLSKWLISENFLRLSFLSQTAGAIANILLNLFLIPLYGALGAAYATLISFALAGFFILFIFPDLKPMALVVTRTLLLPYRVLNRCGKFHRQWRW